MDNIHCKDEELFSNYHVLAVSLLWTGYWT
jgi:hypothetical protein